MAEPIKNPEVPGPRQPEAAPKAPEAKEAAESGPVTPEQLQESNKKTQEKAAKLSDKQQQNLNILEKAMTA